MAGPYDEEIAALIAAIASGTTSVTYRDRSIVYDDLEGLIARLHFLQGASGLNWRQRGVSPETSKGLSSKGCKDE